MDGRDYESAYLSDLSELDRRALKERRILNSSILEKKSPVSLLITREEDISLVLNGMDHIRIQVLSPGLRLTEALKTADQIDDYVNARFDYAFDEKYGYLTSFPTNMGTGMRATAMVHLPSKLAFSSITRDLAIMLPFIFPVERSSNFPVAEISPSTFPEITKS